MSKSDLTALAAELEEYLGDPHDPGSRISFNRVLDHDEHEEYPFGFVSQLRRWGVHEYSLPAEQGGRAGNVETGFNLMRLVARRDSTTATALVITNLSFMPVWIAGTDEQKSRLIAHMKRGGGLSWGLTERAHGSDLIANEMVAEKTEGGWLLTGEKWLIGNATVADTMVLCARTGKRNGPGAYSLFILDKWQVKADAVEELPVEKLHGLRALDLSGLKLKGAFVPDSALVGGEGQGLEIALKSTQVARAVISSLSMSAVDTGLRLTLDFTEQRVLFGGVVSDVPYSRRQLCEAFADLMIADALSLGAVRSIQAAPEQLSIWSSVVKYLAPTLLEKTMSQLNVVLGARYFLRAHPHYGPYQKMLRDLLVANIADGNTVVNLRNIGQQLEGLLATAGSATQEVRDGAAERAATLFGMDRELPVYDGSRQELFSRGGLDDAVLAGPDGVRRLREIAKDAKEADRERLLAAADVAEEMIGRIGVLASKAAELKARLGRGFGQSAELFDLSKEYCLVHAAAAVVLTYVHSHEALEDPLPSAALLLLQLERVRRELYPHEAVTDQSVIDDVMQVLRHLHRENRLFSHWQFPLAERVTDLSAART
ncbi:acyl-CoA dehydrogenase family protein [Streptomyces sp. NBC_00503]|uniref:acyl-CoA dehydrogenase family protein n=1 Tax=Streptomyces sp. NBC_00503 TaxID=2903659 RepID=UPI002E812C59|nr:acyl-CoA dehydrogenase family protein [Streptomyces sp. NBC_00503]WUD86565.1 acyl-CoA dehydrogenase family protein [Streptomyces sp. NBC_00503]